MAEPDRNHSTGSEKKWTYYLGIIGSFITVITFLWIFVKPVVTNAIKEAVSEKIDEGIGKTVTEIDTTIQQVKDDVNTLKDGINALRKDVDQIKDDFYVPFGATFSSDLSPTDAFITYANASYATLDGPIKENNATFLSYKSIVAYSAVAEEEYTVEQVADARVLLPYVENGQEVYFLGQLSESGNWDGNCIINVYKDDELQLITDAVYDDGDLLNCKQVFPYTTSGDKTDVWSISKRTVKNDFASGTTRHFIREKNYTKNFTLDSVLPENILGADAFEATLTGYQEGYYYGNTSNGQFNDDTSTSYMVKYFEDGTVRTLYVGNFHDGQFHDSTGNAWMIGKTEMGGPYSYYRGPFAGGQARPDPKLWEAAIPQERIDEIVSGYRFDCPLTW